MSLQDEKSRIWREKDEKSYCTFSTKAYNDEEFVLWQVFGMKHQHGDILNGPLLSNIITYTIPIILTSVLQLLFNAADLVIVGRFRGSTAVGAVGATSDITMLIVNLFIGLSVGAGVLVAYAIGSRQQETLHRVIHTALPTALVGGGVLTVIGVVFSESFLTMMGTPEQTLPLSALYMRIYFCGITFTMIYNFCASILRAAGDTRNPLLFLFTAGVINAVLNVVFVAGFGMSVDGVALATVISQGISAGLTVRALMRRKDGCRLELRKIRFYMPQLRRMLRIGLPAGIQGALFSISNVLIQSSINSFGPVAVDGNAAAGNLDGFLYVSLDAYSQTALNFTGQNMGAGRYDRVKKILWLCCACCVVTGLAGGLLLYGFGPQLLGVYLTDSTAAISNGMIRLTYVALPYLLCGLMDTTTGMLRGMGVAMAPMLISVLGVCGFRIGWIATVFREVHSLEILYLSYPISWIITFLAQLAVFLVVYRRIVRASGARHAKVSI